ncbi:MAG: TIGR03960 family B12-binding radical SAM protein [bacterium]
MNLEEILGKVQKPGRYIGEEWNIVKKPWDDKKVKIALVFPDLYEVGMSHLGLKILYSLLNNREDCLAERVYAPNIDMESILREKRVPLFSLESKRALRDFDIIGFTLPYELCYTNILSILDLCDIPFKASDRKRGDYPLIIAGGVGAFNPEPLAQFFDAFVIGEGEEVSLEVIDVFSAWKREKADKDVLLENLVKIQGIYVPSLYEISYFDDGRQRNIKPKKDGVPSRISKRFIRNFSESFFPEKFIVPFIETVHDRLMVEISRGCVHGCRFCQAGTLYRPFRSRDSGRVLNLAEEGIKNTGYGEISLSSLCPGDYPDLEGLVDILTARFLAKKVSISLPSLRLDNFPVSVAQKIQEVKKTGFTFALEAGSQRLRDAVNKQVTEENLLEIAEKVTALGWNLLKLYFIIGLPGENERDIEEIGLILDKVSKIMRKRGRGKVNVSLSFFVPKPHTAFQWSEQPGIDVLKNKMDCLKKHTRYPLKFHNPEQSFLEAVISRGDRRIGNVILSAWRKGARFDSWDEHFNFSLWMDAFKENNLDPGFYVNRKRSYDEVFPWDHIDTGVNKEYLMSEHKKSKDAKITLDCLKSGCNNCGMEEYC